MYKKIIITLFYLNIGFGASPINSMAKSFLIPGWSEMDFGYEKSSKFFIQSEIVLLTGCFSAFKVSNLIEKKYMTYASEHAGANNANDDRYWVDVGNYNTNLNFDQINSNHYVFDLVYNPEETKLLSITKRNGAIVKNGYDMLVNQAELSWEIWNK